MERSLLARLDELEKLQTIVHRLIHNISPQRGLDRDALTAAALLHLFQHGAGVKPGVLPAEEGVSADRAPLPEHLPRIAKRVDSPSVERCPFCRRELVFMRSEIREKLEFIEGRFVVKQYIQPQYACEPCSRKINDGATVGTEGQAGRPERSRRA